MLTLTHLMLFWPNIITITVLFSISLSLYLSIVFPISRPIVFIIWIIGLLGAFSSVSYSSPNTWWARSLYKTIMPSTTDIGWTIMDKSKFNHNKQAIYVWYPHSHFAIAPFALVAGNMADNIWKRPIAQCSAPPFFDIPAIRQIALAFGLVRSDYDNLKGTLKQGTSLLIIPGGAREVPLAEHGKIKLVDGRKGFLRLAQEFGLPLIPIFAFGENEFFERPEKENSNFAQTIMKTVGGGLQPPSTSSMLNWLNRPIDPVQVIIGQPFKVDSSDLESSTDAWKTHVNKIYKKYHPSNYADEIEWISKSSS